MYILSILCRKMNCFQGCETSRLILVWSSWLWTSFAMFPSWPSFPPNQRFHGEYHFLLINGSVVTLFSSWSIVLWWLSFPANQRFCIDSLFLLINDSLVTLISSQSTVLWWLWFPANQRFCGDSHILLQKDISIACPLPCRLLPSLTAIRPARASLANTKRNDFGKKRWKNRGNLKAMSCSLDKITAPARFRQFSSSLIVGFDRMHSIADHVKIVHLLTRTFVPGAGQGDGCCCRGLRRFLRLLLCGFLRLHDRFFSIGEKPVNLTKLREICGNRRRPGRLYSFQEV